MRLKLYVVTTNEPKLSHTIQRDFLAESQTDAIELMRRWLVTVLEESPQIRPDERDVRYLRECPCTTKTVTKKWRR